MAASPVVVEDLWRALARCQGGQETLAQAVRLPARLVPGVSWCSGTLLLGRRLPPLTAADHPSARLAHEACVAAGLWPWSQDGTRTLPEEVSIHHRGLVDHPGLRHDLVERTAARDCLSVLMPSEAGTLGALHLWFDREGVVDGAVARAAVSLAAQVGPALERARTRDQLRTALEGRTVIGQAQGLLMERYGLGEARAFEFLVALSRDRNLRLQEVAGSIVRTRKDPTL